MLEEKRRYIMIIAIVSIVLFGLFYNNLLNQKKIEELNNNVQNNNIYEPEILLDSNEDIEEISEIIVYIVGEVHEPGVYNMEEGNRIIDAIEKAGGATSNADLLKINLADYVNDTMQIYVPSKADEGNINDFVTNNVDDGKININKASQIELESLPSIGEVTAKAIIQHRQENGDFKAIEDLMNVSGIGAKTYEGLKEFVKID